MSTTGADLSGGAGRQVAALFVAKGGCYWDQEGIDAWDEERDARKYPGPHVVVAHPPCERWGRYWFGGPSIKVRKAKGDDGGCFLSALASVRRWGGVLEHPANSHAWRAFGLAAPPHNGGWIMADFVGGWTCHVEQGHYGHRAKKATWLYAWGTALPSLIWRESQATVRIDAGFHSTEERRAARGRGERTAGDAVELMGKRERLATPIPFRDLLLSIARSARHA